MGSQAKSAARLTLWLVLLRCELVPVVAFYVIPQFGVRNAPAGHWEMETPLGIGRGLWLALVVFFGLFTLGDIGLIIMIWREFQGRKQETS